MSYWTDRHYGFLEWELKLCGIRKSKCKTTITINGRFYTVRSKRIFPRGYPRYTYFRKYKPLISKLFKPDYICKEM